MEEDDGWCGEPMAGATWYERDGGGGEEDWEEGDDEVDLGLEGSESPGEDEG